MSSETKDAYEWDCPSCHRKNWETDESKTRVACKSCGITCRVKKPVKLVERESKS